MDVVRFTGDDTRPAFLHYIFQEMHGAMVGKHLHKLNLNTLNNMAVTINGLENISEIGGLYYWVREVLTMATCTALLGSQNPMIEDASLVDALW